MTASDRITTICPKCKAKLAVGSQHAGKKLRCPKCKAIVAVPVPASIEDDSDSSDDLAFGADMSAQPVPPPLRNTDLDSNTTPHRPTERKKRRRIVIWSLVLIPIGTAVVSFAAFIAYDWSLVKDQQTEKVYYEHEAALRKIERDSRNDTRDLYYARISDAIEEGEYQRSNDIRAEMDKQEDDWKEEDFREELLKATRER